MSNLTDKAPRLSDAELDALASQQQGEFVKGMRSGGNAAMGSLNNLAGAVGQKVGASDFAAGRYQAADQYTQDAAAAAPRVASMRDVHGVGDFVDWGKGLAGGMVPVGGAALGAALLTGGGAVPAMLAGAGVMAPVEAGDIVGRMREQGQPVDLTRAVVGGVGSAALQNVLPGVARARLGGMAGRIPGGALAAIPEQAGLAAGSEAGKQVAANPAAPLDTHQIGDAAAGGAVMGVPIAGMHALGGARGQIGAAADAVGGAAKDAAKFVGDKAKGVAQATTDGAGAAGAKVDAAAQHVQGMEIPDALTGLFDSAKTKARDVLDKIAKSDDVIGDITKFAGLQGEKLKQALAGDDGERVQVVKDYAKELGDQHPAVRDWLQNVGDHAKQAAVATAKQAQDAAATAREHLAKFADAVEQRRDESKFKRTEPGGDVVDAESFTVEGAGKPRRPKKSEDDSGVREALAAKLIPELLKARPELAQGINDPKQAPKIKADLHRAFAPLIEDLASGKRPSSDVVARLIDLAGPAADRLIEAAHSVVGDSTDQAKTKTFFKGLNEFTQVRDSTDTLVQTLRKNLAKGQERSTDAELRQEAALLAKWRDDKRPAEGPNADPQAQRLHYMVQKHLGMRYGKNAEKVLAALEKAKPKEENQLERAQVKYDADGQPIDSGVDDGFSETGSPNGRLQMFGGGKKGMDLYPHPEDDPGKEGRPGAAMQKLAKVKAAHPDSTPRFITATEMGLDHQWVKDKYKALVKMGNEAGVDGERFARENLDRYGVIATERALQKTDLSFDELDAMKLDRKRYADSKSRIGTGDDKVVLDAVKVVRSMTERFKDEPYTPEDERSRIARLGRMFIEGIAAVQDYMGRTFDIPDGTVLGKLDGRDVTWGDVKKLDTRTGEDRANDGDTKYLTELSKQLIKASGNTARGRFLAERTGEPITPRDGALREAIKADAHEVAGPREARKNKELGREDSRGQLDDALDFDGEVQRGLALGKVRMREIEAELEKVDTSKPGMTQAEADRINAGKEPGEKRVLPFGRAHEAELMEEFGRLSVQRINSARTSGENLGGGQREIDPFGQVHQAAGYRADRDPEPIHTNSGEKREPFLPRRIKEPTRPNDPPPVNAYDEGSPSPKAVAAKKAAFLDRARSGDESLIKEIGQHTDAVGLQNAAAHLNKAVGAIRESATPPGLIAAITEASVPHLETQFRMLRRTADRPELAERILKDIERTVRDHYRGKPAADIDAAVNHVLSVARVEALANVSDKFKARVAEYVDRVFGNDAVDIIFSTDDLVGVGIDGAFGIIHGADGATQAILLHHKRVHSPEMLRSIVYHESAHALFSRLMSDARFEKSIGALVRTATSDAVQRQLDSIYADKPHVRDYYKGNPEEAVAYMYQHWAEGKLTITDKPTVTLFERVKAYLSAFLNGLSDGEHVQHLFEYFKSGELRDTLPRLDLDQLSAAMEASKNQGFINYRGAKTNVVGAIDALNARIGGLVREQPQQAYDLLKANKSMEPADPTRAGPINRKEVNDYITKTLGNSVRLAWERLGHAGEFERIDPGNAPIEDVIRLSVHAMNPLSTAYHESLHAFMQKLSDMKHGKIMDVLMRAGESAHVVDQLRTWMADRGMGDKALEQLKDREERAAYMYQAWADGKLKVGPETKTVLGKIADFVRSVLGIWSNDERALHIMDYFHSGEFAKNMASRDKVGADLMNPGRNRAVETARKMTQPILELGENLGVAGGQRLRDTGIPALRELADVMKLHGNAEGSDAGFLPAARAERTRVMNKMAADLKGFTPDAVNAAMESMQAQSNAAIDALARPEDRLAARQAKVVVRKLLDGMHQYMTDAGVKVNDLGVGKDYFPRVWDTSYISGHQQEFLNMVGKYVAAGQYKGSPKALLHKLMVSEGAEFTSVVDKPGMQHLKPRELAFMSATDTAPFMRKDLPSILNGYVTQATRRAEWARRLGDDGKGVDDLLVKAKRQGATQDDLESAQKFVQAVDGTLGDTINPEARRLFGNMIVYQNVRLLPLMIFSSVVDPMGIAVRGGTVGDAFKAFKRGVAEIPKNFKKGAQDDDATKFAASVGTIDDASLVHTLGALYSQGMVGDTGRKINDTLFRYNLAEQFNTSMRVSATEAAMAFLARHADGTASKHSARWMGELGLQPGEVRLGADGRPLVHEHEGLTLEQSAKMKMAINRWVDGAVLRPDAADKPIWMSDPHFSLIAHLKQFTYSFHETILKRVAHEYQHGNYVPALALASYVPTMIAADMVKGLIQGGGQQPSWKEGWDIGDYIASGVERAGLLGVGQFGVDMLRDAARGGTGVGALSGPTIEQFAEAARVIGGREAFGQFALKSMPANALYAKVLGGEATDPKFVD